MINYLTAPNPSKLHSTSPLHPTQTRPPSITSLSQKPTSLISPKLSHNKKLSTIKKIIRSIKNQKFVANSSYIKQFFDTIGIPRKIYKNLYKFLCQALIDHINHETSETTHKRTKWIYPHSLQKLLLFTKIKLNAFSK